MLYSMKYCYWNFGKVFKNYFNRNIILQSNRIVLYSTLACIRPIKIRLKVVTLVLKNYLYIKRAERNSKAEIDISVQSCTLFFPVTSTSCPKGKKDRFFHFKNIYSALKFTMIRSLKEKAFQSTVF